MYCLVAISVFFQYKYAIYINILIFSTCSILFTQNIHSLFIEPIFNDEYFYELGGIILILTFSYFKLSNKIKLENK